jgi:glutamate N-acetyltransferase/amino-acid N-acetyltransferase
MAVGLRSPTDLGSVPGIRLGTACARIRYSDRADLTVIEIAQGASCAAVFTQNAFCAAPVTLARRHLAAASPRFLLINAGNANAGTGAQGVQDALTCCKALADMTGCKLEQVLPFSTGVIGEPLPVTRIVTAIPDAVDRLSEAGWLDAARGIMTTDTVAKGCSRKITVNARPVAIAGIAKGAGMIRPDMATLLSFIATDAVVNSAVLQACLGEAVAGSFNRITVDGDTSTNDACVLMATGKSGVVIDDADSGGFQQALNEVCLELAQAVIRDGEGANRFVTVQVEEGRNKAECLQVAYTIAHSPLVKTALFAGDPNWGRILAAVGRAGIGDLDIQRVQIYLHDVCIVRDGERASGYRESAGKDVMAREEILIRVVLGRGKARESVWTTDLSYDYVRINAEYRT